MKRPGCPLYLYDVLIKVKILGGVIFCVHLRMLIFFNFLSGNINKMAVIRVINQSKMSMR